MTHTMEVEVVDVRKIVGDGKLKALADVKFGGCLVVKGFCVFKGKDGYFVSMPSKASKDGKWFPVLDPKEELKEEIEQKVLESFDAETDGAR